jgi:hypothetical protein
VIQKAISEAVERFIHRGATPQTLTFRYLWESLRGFTTRRPPRRAADAGTDRPAYPGSLGSTDAMAPPTIRSRKVRRILVIEARARRLLTRYERTLAKAVRIKTEVHRLLDHAHGIEWTLTGGQVGELRLGRAERGTRPSRPDAPMPAPSSSPATPQ